MTMPAKYSLTITEQLSAQDLQLCHFVAKLDLNLIRAYGDNYNEPYEPEHFELADVTQISGPYIPPKLLAEWADAYVYGHQESIMDQYDADTGGEAERLEERLEDSDPEAHS